MKWRTKEQRRTDRERELIARGWHRAFCWLPVVINGHVHWMTFVKRKYSRGKHWPYLLHVGYWEIEK